MVRQCEGKGGEAERGCGVAWSHRILESLPAAMANFGEKFCRPGGAISRGSRGELGRRPGAIYRCGRGMELGRHLIELKQRN
jgi:hypothetical protein